MPNNALPLSAAQAARHTGIPKRTILAAITRGELPAHKMPGRTGAYLIDQIDLDTYVARRVRAAS
jgi:excisionase family DNA binding protein